MPVPGFESRSFWASLHWLIQLLLAQNTKVTLNKWKLVELGVVAQWLKFYVLDKTVMCSNSSTLTEESY